jgi:hypothetical protein
MKTELFTPLRENTRERATMQISPDAMADYERAKRNQWTLVYDYITKKSYLVRSASCGLKCRYDAMYKDFTLEAYAEILGERAIPS